MIRLHVLAAVSLRFLETDFQKLVPLFSIYVQLVSLYFSVGRRQVWWHGGQNYCKVWGLEYAVCLFAFNPWFNCRCQVFCKCYSRISWLEYFPVQPSGHKSDNFKPESIFLRFLHAKKTLGFSGKSIVVYFRYETSQNTLQQNPFRFQYCSKGSLWFS